MPAIVRWPGVTRPGAASDAQVMTMDWLPTFLAAAGVSPPAHFPSDGVDIAPALRGEVLPERALFWRFSNHGQKAARRGRHKYLEIAGNSFLFDVVADPMERGNLKEREPALFAALRDEWDIWNAAMLPPDPLAQTHGFNGRDLAEYYGIDS